MTDIFPEDSYDDNSGEYSSDFDFDPIFSYRVDINSEVYAEVKTDHIDFDPLTQDIASKLEDLVNYGYFDVDGNRNPLDYRSLSNSDFDTQSPTSRGPFINSDAVERWLDETGLRDMVDVWYDDDNDIYWIDADTGSI